MEEKLYDKIWKRKSKGDQDSIGQEGRAFEALNTIGHGEFLVDIGCGSGNLALHAQNNHEQEVGAGIFLKALKSISQRSFPVLQTNLSKGFIPLENNSADSVICLDVIEHLYDPFLLIKKVIG